MIGHSGCLVERSGLYVIKHCNHTYPIERLKKQVEKQKWFYKNGILSCPKIKSETNLGGYGFIMKYINVDNIYEYDEYELKWFVFQISNLISWELLHSKELMVDSSVFFKKSEEIKEKTGINIDFDFKTIKMPIGFCHGDLTLENILPKFPDVYLIDFLDSFIDSPWIDVVKLRQDTKHHWSLRHLESKYEKNILNYIDNYFSHTIPEDIYKQLQIINLARILPYANKQEKKFLMKEIECLKLT